MSESPRHYRAICNLTLMFVALLLSEAAGARTIIGLLRELQRIFLPVQSMTLGDYEHNPATMMSRDSVSLSSLAVGMDLNREDKPVMEQTGDGHDLVRLSASSFTRLGERSVVWGDAAFVTGKYRDVRWTDCIDYMRVAPYVLGDEVGGDLSTRNYSFAGGYARNYGRWDFGGHVAYRAEIAYRNRDPRVKSVVSDLSVNAGAAYRFGHYQLGLKGGINVYNQSCDLDFYSPINEINTYTLTGMGTYYRRFMGNTNKNSGYSSFGYDAGLQWLPAGEKSGLSVTVGYTHYRMEQQLRNFNNLTLGYTDNDLVAFSVAYRFALSGALVFRPLVRGQMFSRKGTENLFGTSAGASYDKIGSRNPYDFSARSFDVTLPFELTAGVARFTVAPQMGYTSRSESYSEPYRHLAVIHFIPGLQFDFSTVSSGKWLWNLTANASCAKADTSEPVLTDLETSTSLGRCVLDNYSMLKADRRSFGVNCGVSHALSSFILSLRADYDMTDYVGEGKCHRFMLTLGASF